MIPRGLSGFSRHYGAYFLRAAEPLPASRRIPTVRNLELRRADDRLTLHVHAIGPESGREVAVLQGLGERLDLANPFFQTLAEGDAVRIRGFTLPCIERTPPPASWSFGFWDVWRPELAGIAASGIENVHFQRAEFLRDGATRPRRTLFLHSMGHHSALKLLQHGFQPDIFGGVSGVVSLVPPLHRNDDTLQTAFAKGQDWSQVLAMIDEVRGLLDLLHQLNCPIFFFLAGLDVFFSAEKAREIIADFTRGARQPVYLLEWPEDATHNLDSFGKIVGREARYFHKHGRSTERSPRVAQTMELLRRFIAAPELPLKFSATDRIKWEAFSPR